MPDDGSISLLQIAFVVVVSVLLLAFLFSVFIHFRMHIIAAPTSNINPSTPPPSHRILSEAEVTKLSLLPFNPRTINNEACPVCLEDFRNEEMLRCLPCFHAYHDTCITPWLYFRSPCCPLCKADVRTPPPLRYRLRSVMQNWSNYARSITLPLLKFGSSRNQSSVDTVVQVSNSIEVLQMSVLEQTPDQPPGAYN